MSKYQTFAVYLRSDMSLCALNNDMWLASLWPTNKVTILHLSIRWRVQKFQLRVEIKPRTAQFESSAFTAWPGYFTTDCIFSHISILNIILKSQNGRLCHFLVFFVFYIDFLYFSSEAILCVIFLFGKNTVIIKHSTDYFSSSFLKFEYTRDQSKELL